LQRKFFFKKEHKKANIVVELGTIVDKKAIIIAKKHIRGQFTTTWTPISIKEVGDKFYWTF